MVSVRMQSCVLTVLLVHLSSCVVSCLYFHIAGTEEKCFLEEVPEETLLVVNYRTQLYDPQRDQHLPAPPDLRMLVVARDPDDQLVPARPSGPQGRLRFVALKPGAHQICLQPSSEQPLPAGRLLTVHLDVKVGEQTVNYTAVAAREKLTELQLRVRRLAEQVDQIQREQNYQRVREQYFREVNHNISMWIFWWPVARSLYVVAVIIWHTKSW